MLIIDDFVPAPERKLLFIFRQVYEPVETEAIGECSALRAQFVDLSTKREAGEISEAEFHTRGSQLLRGLQKIERSTEPSEAVSDDHS